MLARLEFARFIWIFLLVAVASLAFGAGRAEAETGLASWYGSGLTGNLTASGEPYNPNGYTAAHKTLPLGTELVVSYRGRSVNVTVNDRGPYSGGRDLDLSQSAAQAIGLTRAGVDYVQYSAVGRGGYGGAAYGKSRGYRVEQNRAPREDQTSYAAGRGYGGGSGAYVVRSGDTLYEIAGNLGVSVNYLVNANDLADPDVLAVGQRLYY